MTKYIQRVDGLPKQYMDCVWTCVNII